MQSIERLISFGSAIQFPGLPSARIERLSGGTLRAEQKLLFCDVFWPFDDRLALAPSVVTGRVDVAVWLGAVSVDERNLVGAVLLELHAAPVVEWMRLPDAGGEPSMAMVDNRSLLIVDDSRLAEVQSFRDEDPGKLIDRLNLDPVVNVGHAVLVRCGMGDGAYDIWQGLDNEGRTVQILVDLGLFHEGVIL